MAGKPDLSKAEMRRRGMVPPAPVAKSYRTIRDGQEVMLKHKRDVSKARARQDQQRIASFRTPSQKPPANPPTYASAPGRWQNINGRWTWQQQRADGAWENVAGY